ncbi:MAG: hypothetical protein KKB20_21240 [Proteobacteria bacterium]|nr:hypothetical protein [Pseudomonadota bacterium]
MSALSCGLYFGAAMGAMFGGALGAVWDAWFAGALLGVIVGPLVIWVMSRARGGAPYDYTDTGPYDYGDFDGDGY